MVFINDKQQHYAFIHCDKHMIVVMNILSTIMEQRMKHSMKRHIMVCSHVQVIYFKVIS